MPIGENIGQAYIRIYADGSGVPDDIRDSMKDADSDIKAAGNRHSKAYDEAFARQKKSAPSRKKIRDSIISSVAEGDYLRDGFFKGSAWRTFEQDTERRWGEIGQVAAANLKRELQEGMSFDEFTERIGNFRREVADATRQVREQEQQIIERQLAGNQRLRNEREATFRAYRYQLRQLTRDSARFSAGEGGDRQALLRTSAALRTQLDALRALHPGVAEVTSRVDDMTDSLVDHDRILRRSQPDLDRQIRGFTRFADVLGRISGRGSRNDFLNVIGGMTRSVALLPAVVLRGVKAFRNFRDGVDGATTGAGRLISGLGGFLSITGRAAAGLAGMMYVIGPLASAFSLAAGAVTALVSTLGMGLIGGVGALGGAILPVVALIGGLALAIKGLETDTPQMAALASDFRDLRSEFSQMVFPDFDSVVGSLRDGLAAVRPMMLGVAGAIQQTLAGTFDVFSGPIGSQFLATMETFLPHAVRTFGRAFNNALGGFLGFFRGLTPITDRFLGWVETVTARFSEWSNSFAGQQTIRAFFQDAGDSAAELGGFLGAVWGWLGAIIQIGNEAGDTIFGKMTDAIDGWTASIQANPEPMREWFADAVDFAGAVGRLAGGFARLFDLLDTEASRVILDSVLTSIGGAMDVVSTALGPLVDLFTTVNGATGGFAGALLGAMLLFPRFGRALQGVGRNFTTFRSELSSMPGKLNALKAAVSGVAGVGGMALLTMSAQSSSEEIRTLGSIAGGALTGFAVGGPIGAAVGAGAGLISALGAAHADAAQQVDTLAGTLDAETGAITDNTRQAALNILQKDGWLDYAQEQGIALGDVTAALNGNEAAMKRVKDQIDAQKGSGFNPFNSDAWTRDSGEFLSALDRTRGKIQKAQGDHKQLDEAQKNSAGSARRAASAEGSLANQLSRSARATQSFNDGLKVLNGFLDKRGAVRSYEAAVDEFTKGIRENGKSFDVNTEKGRANQERLDAIARSAGEVGSKMKGVNKIEFMQGAENRIKTIADRLGLPKRATEDLIEKLREAGRIKAEPKIDVRTADANAVVSDLEVRLAQIPDQDVKINVSYNRTGLARAPAGGPDHGAMGRLIGQPTTMLVGEAGPEAIVPLRRPLGMVDPAVRWLSAIAQGKEVPRMGSGGVVGAGKTVNVEQHIYSPQTDPRAVANEAINALVGVGY